jgi:calcium-dependent secretion activator
MTLLLLTGDDEHKRPTRMQPLNSESILTKEQLFDMFQQILGVKKFEHQILYNALMVRSFPPATMNIRN